jgi:hypothetical protein
MCRLSQRWLYSNRKVFYRQRGPKVTYSLVARTCRAKHLRELRGLHDAHHTRILQITFAWHARVTSANPMQMLCGTHTCRRRCSQQGMLLLDPSDLYMMNIGQRLGPPLHVQQKCTWFGVEILHAQTLTSHWWSDRVQIPRINPAGSITKWYVYIVLMKSQPQAL